MLSRIALCVVVMLAGCNVLSPVGASTKPDGGSQHEAPPPKRTALAPPVDLDVDAGAGAVDLLRPSSPPDLDPAPDLALAYCKDQHCDSTADCCAGSVCTHPPSDPLGDCCVATGAACSLNGAPDGGPGDCCASNTEEIMCSGICCVIPGTLCNRPGGGAPCCAGTTCKPYPDGYWRCE